jgi:hypothetical protein
LQVTTIYQTLTLGRIAMGTYFLRANGLAQVENPEWSASVFQA